MDLDLSLLPRVRGRAALPLAFSFVRELTAADMALTQEPRGTTPTRIKKLRDRHHGLARCLSQGMADQEASLVTGYGISTISILKGDPTFQELLAFYHEQNVQIRAELTERMASLSLDAVEEIHSRLEDAPEEFDVGDLLEVAKFSADRTGHAPVKQSTMNVNVNVGLAARMEAAAKRVAEAKVIEHRSDEYVGSGTGAAPDPDRGTAGGTG